MLWLLVTVASAIHFVDFDCLFIEPPLVHSNQSLDWSSIRRASKGISSDILRDLLTSEASSQCPLGKATACLSLLVRSEQVDCDFASLVSLFPVENLISTSFPILGLLEVFWKMYSKGDPVLDCDSFFHPSINWKELRKVFTNGLSTGGQTLALALEESNGIVWKASSGAVHAPTGKRVEFFSQQCPLALAVAYNLRTLGLLLSPAGAGDTMRIAQMYLEISTRWLTTNMHAVLSSQWPLIPSLRIMSNLSTKRGRESLRVDPRYNWLSDLKSGKKFLVFVPDRELRNLRILLTKYNQWGLIENMRILTNSEIGHSYCESINIRSLCLPLLSTDPLIAKWLAIYSFLENGGDVFYHHSDFVVLHDPSEFSDWTSEIVILPDLFSRMLSTNVIFLRSSAKQFARYMLEWALAAPFGDERAAVYYLLERNSFGIVPSVSFFPHDLPIFQSDHFDKFSSKDGFTGNFYSMNGIDWGCENQLLKCSDELRVLWSGGEVEISRLLNMRKHGDFAGNPKQWDAPIDLIVREVSGDAGFALLLARRDICVFSGETAMDLEFSSLYHVNFAHLCCEEDQQLSSRSALIWGFKESKALNGTILDSEFLSRNDDLLNFDRTKFIAGKTPTGVKGYYVWKPYAILKGICDLPMGAVVVWTDAGVQVKADVRPLLRKYLEISDMTAVAVESLEASRSKRDAFIILDADFESIAYTNQVASGIIAFRKTPRTVRFLEWWLAACEQRKIISEEPSSLGVPEYPVFVNSNDDQTAFSLLFKKFRFVPFSWTERERYFIIARNVAKFVQASDAFALGQKTDVDDYKKAADERTKQDPLQQPINSSSISV